MRFVLLWLLIIKSGNKRESIECGPTNKIYIQIVINEIIVYIKIYQRRSKDYNKNINPKISRKYKIKKKKSYQSSEHSRFFIFINFISNFKLFDCALKKKKKKRKWWRSLFNHSRNSILLYKIWENFRRVVAIFVSLVLERV